MSAPRKRRRLPPAVADAVSTVLEAQINAAAAPREDLPPPCDDPALKRAPVWAKHLCAEIGWLKLRLSRVERRIAGAAMGGLALAELLHWLLGRIE